MNTCPDVSGSTTHVALHLLINQLSLSLLDTATDRRNTLINEVAPCLLVKTNPAKLGCVIRQLLQTVVTVSENSYIRLSAKTYGDVLLIHIKKKCPVDEPGISEHLEPLQKMVEELHGNVSVTSHRNEVTTVALSFVNRPVTA